MKTRPTPEELGLGVPSWTKACDLSRAEMALSGRDLKAKQPSIQDDPKWVRSPPGLFPHAKGVNFRGARPMKRATLSSRFMVHAASTKPDPKDLARLIEKNLEIPSIPDVAAKALRALNDEQTTAAKVAGLISEDQGMTARVLKVANSALYGLTREVTNLQQAAMVMGFDTLRGIIITVSNRAIYKRFGAVEKELWQHSVATAIASQHIAVERDVALKDEAFVCGLMHDVGKVVMNNSMRDQFMASRQMADDQHISDVEAEQAVFGFSHCDVGSLLVQRWGLSEHLEHAVFLHHEPDLAPMLAGDSEPLVYVTHVADQICYRLGYGKGSGRDDGETVDLEAFCSLGFEADELGPLCRKVDATYQDTHGSF